MPRYIIEEILYLECFQTMIRHLWQTVPSWERKKAEDAFMGNKNVAKTSDTGAGQTTLDCARCRVSGSPTPMGFSVHIPSTKCVVVCNE